MMINNDHNNDIIPPGTIMERFVHRIQIYKRYIALATHRYA